MNEFCSKVEVFLVSDVLKVSKTEVSLRSGKSGYIFLADEFNLTAKGSTTDAGTLYNVDETLIIEKVSDDIASIFRTERSVIIALNVTNGSRILGTLELPVKISITQQLNRSQLILKSKSVISPL